MHQKLIHMYVSEGTTPHHSGDCIKILYASLCCEKLKTPKSNQQRRRVVASPPTCCCLCMGYRVDPSIHPPARARRGQRRFLYSTDGDGCSRPLPTNCILPAFGSGTTNCSLRRFEKATKSLAPRQRIQRH